MSRPDFAEAVIAAAIVLLLLLLIRLEHRLEDLERRLRWLAGRGPR